MNLNSDNKDIPFEDDRKDDNLVGQDQNTSYEEQKAERSADKKDDEIVPDVPTDIETGNLEDKNHQQHGNRKYQAFKNHSSASDQPRTATDTNFGREH